MKEERGNNNIVTCKAEHPKSIKIQDTEREDRGDGGETNMKEKWKGMRRGINRESKGERKRRRMPYYV